MSRIQQLRAHRYFAKLPAALSILAVAVVGTAFTFNSRAATPFASLEPEQGSLNGSATVVSDASASGGSAVQFGGSNRLLPLLTSPGQPGTYMIHFGGPVLDVATEAPRRKVFFLNPDEYPKIAEIKAANPNALVFVYKDLSSTRDWDCINGVDRIDLTSGVGYCDTNANHPEWFLKDTAGNRLTYSSYPGHWQLDIGNPEYQQKWLENVKANLQLRGWDGVIMDNALVHADTYHQGVVPAAYPTNESFQAAYLSMLDIVGPGLKDAGFITSANITDSRLYPGLWSKYIRSIDIGHDEFWIAFGTGSRVWDWGETGWKDQLAEVTAATAQGKSSIVRVQSCGGAVSFRYGLASYLLVNDGRSMVGMGCGDGTSDAWYPEYDWDLGTPGGAYYQLPGYTSVFRRDFSQGTVIVNASQNTTYTFSLGSNYLDENGNTINSVTLNGTEATILRKL